MIIIKGSITDVTEGIVVHQVNCRNRIGAGVSGAIIKKWPKVELEFHRLSQKTAPVHLLGQTQFIKISEPIMENQHGLTIVNLFSQLNYGNSTKTGVVYTDIKALVTNILKICYENPNVPVYIPYGIGCGLAGADWNEVSSWLKDPKNLHAIKLN